MPLTGMFVESSVNKEEEPWVPGGGEVTPAA